MTGGTAPVLQGFTREYLLQLFSYDPETGAITRRIARSNMPAGALVGTGDGKGYLHVSIAKKFVRLHRLAYFLHTGETPRGVDHKDRNRRNNAFSNLRPATCTDNAGNSGVLPQNTSGFRGVSRNTRSGKWHAQIKLQGKQTYLGRFDTPEEAARCYDIAAREHFGGFATTNYAE